jgi:hypothetical protein
VTIIKVLLLLALLVVGLQAFRGSSRPIHKVLWRGYLVLLLIVGALAVIFPDALTWVANRVGVGRGADLLLYGLCVTSMLLAVVLFRRLGELERRCTQLARALALHEAAGHMGGEKG